MELAANVTRRAILGLAANPLVARAVRKYGMSLGAARFVAGRDIGEAMAAVRDLNAAGFKVTLDCLGEDIADPEAARQASSVYLEVLDRIAAEGADANVSLKLTQMGLDLNPDLCRELLGDIVTRAAQHGNFVRIDMESSRHTRATLEIFREFIARRRRDNVGLVLQAYLYRTFQDLCDLHRLAADLKRRPEINIRFCKGAYREPHSVAYPTKAAVDANYRRLVQYHLEAGHYAAAATHDDLLIEQLVGYVDDRGMDRSRFEFQMLYGIRRDLQRSLLERGFTVRVYVPFGTEWYAYYMRRLAERPANVLFLLRSLLRERNGGKTS